MDTDISELPGSTQQSIEMEVVLPSDNWKTTIIEQEVIEGDDSFPNVKLRFFINIKTKEEFRRWLSEYETITGSSYVISSTDIENGQKVLLKQRLRCHHFTRCKKMYDPSLKNKTRNTNCPSKLYMKIHVFRKNYRGKQKYYQLLEQMPCEIVLIANHNHSVGTVDSLRFRKVSDSVKEELINLYKNGHSPGTALEMIRSRIQLSEDDCTTALADRNQCPSYKYCYDLYLRECKLKNGSVQRNSEATIFLQDKVKQYNDQCGETCAKMLFLGEGNDDYVIGICTPIMKRVHGHIEAASRIVYMDSWGTVDKDGNTIFVLSTESECGVLPLGLLITTSDSTRAITVGFEILKELLGEITFGGHEEGPKVFMTDDSVAQEKAILDTWPRAKRFLCSFHVLKAVYRWLSKTKNGVPKDQQLGIYNGFRSVLYAKNVDDMMERYELVADNARFYPNYSDYLNNYWWPKRESWVKAFRSGWVEENGRMRDYSESVIREMHDKIFPRIKPFDVVQKVDYLLSKFEGYHERKLLDASSNRTRENPFYKQIKEASTEVLEGIVKLEDNIVSMPSETTPNLTYLVNMEVLMCSCIEGTTGSSCKHIDWANTLFCTEEYVSPIDNYDTRKKLFFVATGQTPKDDQLSPSVMEENKEGILEEIKEDTSEESVSVQTEDFPEVECTEDAFGGNTNIELIDYEEVREKFENLFNQIAKHFGKHFEESPLEVTDSLEKMVNALGDIKTTEGFSSAVAAFGTGEMGKKCALKNCKNYQKEPSYGSEVSFHGLPKIKEAREKWLNAIPKDLLRGNASNIFLCSAHFTPESFQPASLGLSKNMLRRTAVPSIFEDMIETKPGLSKATLNHNGVKLVNTTGDTKKLNFVNASDECVYVIMKTDTPDIKDNSEPCPVVIPTTLVRNEDTDTCEVGIQVSLPTETEKELRKKLYMFQKRLERRESRISALVTDFQTLIDEN